ncbi:hypothetical protein [Photobacterium aquae]|uniref:hypothetical protein n=1 Tax=Photobacterium aquae TaxID=1195763 RepID=UPI000ABECB7B|nr:hypothetical protein [Photobacterium aquae]
MQVWIGIVLALLVASIFSDGLYGAILVAVAFFLVLVVALRKRPMKRALGYKTE